MGYKEVDMEIAETGNMSGLKRFHGELMSIFASSIETEMGFLLLVDWLGEALKDPRVETFFPVQLGKGDPRLSSTIYQYEKPLEELIRDSREGGQNVRLYRNGVIALTYALWEEEYRATIATECGLASKNEVGSDVFQDLNKYRQAILHRGARLGREPTKMSFFAKGDIVSFTKDQMHDLFAQLIEELNRIGEEYYGQNPGFTLDKPLH